MAKKANKKKGPILKPGDKLPSGRIVSNACTIITRECAYMIKRHPDLGYPKDSVVEYYNGYWYIGDRVKS